MEEIWLLSVTFATALLLSAALIPITAAFADSAPAGLDAASMPTADVTVSLKRAEAALDLLATLARKSDSSLPPLRPHHEREWLAKLDPLLQKAAFRDRLRQIGFEGEMAWAQTLAHLVSVMLYLRHGRDEETLARLRDLMDRPLPEERKRRIQAMILALEPTPEAIAMVRTLLRQPHYREILERLSGLD